MSKMTLPYLSELMSAMNDPRVRREKAVKLLEPHWRVKNGYFESTAEKGKHTYYIRSGGWCCATSHIHCVFGGFNDSNGLDRDERVCGSIRDCVGRMAYTVKAYNYGQGWGEWKKRGIEILHAQPNATGSTYSRKCFITVKELKEACKMNGIKTTGLDKRGLLNALMKV